MYWLITIAILFVSNQPESNLADQPAATEQAMKGFELYSQMVKLNAGVAEDHVDDGTMLLFYRAAHFVNTHGNAPSTDAIRCAARAVLEPEAKKLGARLGTGPIEIEARDNPSAALDEQ